MPTVPIAVGCPKNGRQKMEDPLNLKSQLEQLFDKCTIPEDVEVAEYDADELLLASPSYKKCPWQQRPKMREYYHKRVIKVLVCKAKARVLKAIRDNTRRDTEETQPDDITSYHVELNLEARTLVVGTNTFTVTSVRVWAFLNTLASDRKHHQMTPVRNWKTARDMLRKIIQERMGKETGKKVLKRIIPSSKGVYILDQSVVVKYGGQLGNRKTILSR